MFRFFFALVLICFIFKLSTFLFWLLRTTILCITIYYASTSDYQLYLQNKRTSIITLERTCDHILFFSNLFSPVFCHYKLIHTCIFSYILGFEKILLFNIHTHSTNLQITLVRKIDHKHTGRGVRRRATLSGLLHFV